MAQRVAPWDGLKLTWRRPFPRAQTGAIAGGCLGLPAAACSAASLLRLSQGDRKGRLGTARELQASLGAPAAAWQQRAWRPRLGRGLPTLVHLSELHNMLPCQVTFATVAAHAQLQTHSASSGWRGAPQRGMASTTVRTEQRTDPYV